MPRHHNLEAWLNAYTEAAGLIEGRAWLFQMMRGRSGKPSGSPMQHPDAYRMIERPLAAAHIRSNAGGHSVRATGISEYLRNGGKLEIAQRMANHESARTTGL